MPRLSAITFTLLLLTPGLARGRPAPNEASCTCLAPTSDEHTRGTSWRLRRAPVVEGTRISSRFSLRRLNPLLHEYLPHYGDDIAAKEIGSEVLWTVKLSHDRKKEEEARAAL